MFGDQDREKFERAEDIGHIKQNGYCSRDINFQ